ncbi:hypothetical protein [Kocuria himachalensis]
MSRQSPDAHGGRTGPDRSTATSQDPPLSPRRTTEITHHRHTTRTAAAALVAAAGLGLAGCGTEEPETGTDVEDVTEGEVLESSPAPENTPTTVDPLLVLYNMDRIDIEEGQVVEVSGTVQQAFDLPTVEDELYQDYDQQPYLEATDVQLIPDE